MSEAAVSEVEAGEVGAGEVEAGDVQEGEVAAGEVEASEGEVSPGAVTPVDRRKSDILTSVGSSAYSFYLNIVVLDNIVPPSSSSPAPEEADPSEEQGQQCPPQTNEVVIGDAGLGVPVIEEGVPIDDSVARLPNGGVPNFFAKGPFSFASMNNALKMTKQTDLLSKSFHRMDEAMRGNMDRLSASAQNVSKTAVHFVNTKTMVSRALSSLNKSLPDIAKASEDLELSMGKRFHQSKVIVLHVVLKASAMARYIKEIQGEENAEHYQSAMSTLKQLGATETMGSLEKEMLPVVRKGLMSKLSELLVNTMKEKEKDLEIECIALEEAEEARWLFTFMEFQSQMK